MEITISFQTADLFNGWEDSDIIQYDQAASAARYADMVEREVRAMYPEADVTISCDEQPDGVEIWREVGEEDPTPFIQGIEEQIYQDYKWVVMLPPWDVVEDILRDTLEELEFAPGSGEANALGRLVDIVFDQGKRFNWEGLMGTQGVADHFGVTPRRARQLIVNRGVGKQIDGSGTWIVHEAALGVLAPRTKYRRK